MVGNWEVISRRDSTPNKLCDFREIAWIPATGPGAGGLNPIEPGTETGDSKFVTSRPSATAVPGFFRDHNGGLHSVSDTTQTTY